eukprot:3879834-Pleurochrysis_carterae.AAC.1
MKSRRGRRAWRRRAEEGAFGTEVWETGQNGGLEETSMRVSIRARIKSPEKEFKAFPTTVLFVQFVRPLRVIRGRGSEF